MQRKKNGIIIYCYAVDITDTEVSGIKLFGLNKLLKISDAVCQASFFRLFST